MYKAIAAFLFAGLIMTQVTAGAGQVSKLRRVTDPSYVCMVNNEVMGKPQTPVKVGSQTYYGCCKMCVGTLTNDRKARFAIDPVSGREVDKAKAVIGAKPNGEVLYFVSEKTFTTFIKGE